MLSSKELEEDTEVKQEVAAGLPDATHNSALLELAAVFTLREEPKKTVLKHFSLHFFFRKQLVLHKKVALTFHLGTTNLESTVL